MARLTNVKVAPACAVFAVLAVAGCSASHPLSASALSASGSSRSSDAPASSSGGASSSTAPGQSSNATGTGSSAGSTGTGANAGTTVGNITTAPAGSMQAGPVKITPVYCGRLSAAQQAQFQTTATGGLIYRYANRSGSAVQARLFVKFTDGTTQVGGNYTGTVPDLAPGQSAEGEVDAMGIAGQNLTFTGCDVESYTVTSSLGMDPVSYAGLRSMHGRNA
jgi:hypothetical protein